MKFLLSYSYPRNACGSVLKIVLKDSPIEDTERLREAKIGPETHTVDGRNIGNKTER